MTTFVTFIVTFVTFAGPPEQAGLESSLLSLILTVSRVTRAQKLAQTRHRAALGVANFVKVTKVVILTLFFARASKSEESGLLRGNPS